MTEYQPPQGVASLLEQLGATRTEVWNSLLKLGIRGRRRKVRSCPVAKYLQANGWPQADVGSFSAWADARSDPVPLPEPVEQFVRSFDRGNYKTVEGD